MSFTAKDVQALRQATGAGMMDAKRALEANDGDAGGRRPVAAGEGAGRGGQAAERDNTQGAVSLFVDGNVGSIVQLKCETDFVASSRALQEAGLRPGRAGDREGRRGHGRAGQGARGPAHHAEGEHRARPGRAHRGRPADVLDSYLHIQGGRGVNGVLVELAGGNAQLAHDIAVHIAFARPKYLAATTCPADVVEKERATLEAITRNEGKPEQAIPKIVEGRLNGFFKDVCLLEQPYAKDDKQSDQGAPRRGHGRALRPGRDRLRPVASDSGGAPSSPRGGGSC